MSNIIRFSAARKLTGGMDGVAIDLPTQASLVEQIAAVIRDLETTSRRIHSLIAYIAEGDIRRRHMADADRLDALIETARVRFEEILEHFLDQLSAAPR
jgi:hypothetical protein